MSFNVTIQMLTESHVDIVCKTFRKTSSIETQTCKNLKIKCVMNGTHILSGYLLLMKNIIDRIEKAMFVCLVYKLNIHIRVRWLYTKKKLEFIILTHILITNNL